MDDTFNKFARHATELQEVADGLCERFDRLSSFNDALNWHLDASALTRLLEQFFIELTEYQTIQNEALKQAEISRSSQSFFKRSFGSREEERRVQDNLSKAARLSAGLGKSVSDLQDLIARTPRNKAEQKVILGELVQVKKDLTLEKRSVNEAMRQIRTDARQKTTALTGVSGRGFIATAARYDRASIRRAKESALAPQEDAKTSIERKLIEVERRINWVTRLASEEPTEQPAVLRCAYCGRRVEPESVCPGCGSDKTVVSMG